MSSGIERESLVVKRGNSRVLSTLAVLCFTFFFLMAGLVPSVRNKLTKPRCKALSSLSYLFREICCLGNISLHFGSIIRMGFHLV